jgi:hypothetical protein
MVLFPDQVLQCACLNQRKGGVQKRRKGGKERLVAAFEKLFSSIQNPGNGVAVA